MVCYLSLHLLIGLLTALLKIKTDNSTGQLCLRLAHVTWLKYSIYLTVLSKGDGEQTQNILPGSSINKK